MPGRKASDFKEPEVEVWEEVWDAVCLFSLLSSQKKYSGMGTCTGLEMGIFLHELDRKGVTGEEYDQFIVDLRSIERAVVKNENKRDD